MPVNKVSLLSYAPLPEGDEQYAREFIRANRVLKLMETGDLVTVGAVEADDAQLKTTLTSYHRKPVNIEALDATEFAAYLGRLMSGDPAEPGSASNEGKLDLEALASDGPVINLVNSICIEAIRQRASDIHLEAFPDGVAVRYRIDGVLRTVQSLPPERFPALASRVKVMAGLNLMERRRPQDGRITVNLAGRTVDMRVSCVPTAAATGSESIVMRIFNAENASFGLKDLGLEQDCLEGVRELLRSPHGMILVTGPTGSGKSSTLNAMIRSISSEALKIITIEDPVEYVIPGVDQIQTDERIGLTFGALLRRVLRQDPDVILVGEIRDAETAELAVRAALTGHLVLSTLHTNDAVSAVPRLADLGVEPYLTAAVLRGVVAQRLVRRLCPACRTEGPLEHPWDGIFASAGIPTRALFRSAGCPACYGRGFRGRFASAEFFRVDEELGSMIAAGANRDVLGRRLAEKGMTDLKTRGLSLAAAGQTSPEELQRAGVL